MANGEAAHHNILRHQFESMEQVRIDQLLRTNPEINICHHFGCGKHLTLQETLCGSRCSEHSFLPPPPDVTKMVSY